MALEKTNIPGYMKDSRSSIIVNTNSTELSEYRAHRARLKKEREIQFRMEQMAVSIELLKERIERLENKCQL